MKKNLKKLFAILMTVAVVLSMALPAMAANNQFTGSRTDVTVDPLTAPKTGSITINGDKTFTVYKVFSANVEEGNHTYTWTPDPAWKGVTIPPAETLAGYKAEQMIAFANSLVNDATGKPQPVKGELSDLPLGYYLLVDEEGEGLTKSQPILVAIPQVVDDAWVYNITVTPKSSSTSFEKKIKEGEELVDTNTKNVGDFVEYYLSADVPTYSSEAKDIHFEITDNMSKELTWVNGTSTVSVYTVKDRADIINATTEGTEIKVPDFLLTAPTADTEGGSFTVEFQESFLRAHPGEVVVVIFSAKLNEKAVIGNTEEGKDNKIGGYIESGENVYNGKGNPNGAKLTYSNSYYGGDGTKTIEDTVTTFTFEIDVKKIDAEKLEGVEQTLRGAKFEVYKENKEDLYTNDLTGFNGTLETGIDGTATVTGLDKGIYYLKETEAPAGYKVYPDWIKVTIVQPDDNDGNFTYTVDMGEKGTENEVKDLKVVTVEDEKGASLPGTGGIGTTIFTFGGLALIVLAGILLVVYTRKQKKA